LHCHVHSVAVSETDATSVRQSQPLFAGQCLAEVQERLVFRQQPAQICTKVTCVVLDGFPTFGMVGDFSGADDGIIHVAGSQCVEAGKVPNQAPTIAHSSTDTVVPSGRLPSSLDRECGSSITGMLADVNARLIRSCIALWRTICDMPGRGYCNCRLGRRRHRCVERTSWRQDAVR
jgi:hypothetical protein